MLASLLKSDKLLIYKAREGLPSSMASFLKRKLNGSGAEGGGFPIQPEDNNNCFN